MVSNKKIKSAFLRILCASKLNKTYNQGSEQGIFSPHHNLCIVLDFQRKVMLVHVPCEKRPNKSLTICIAS